MRTRSGSGRELRDGGPGRDGWTIRGESGFLPLFASLALLVSLPALPARAQVGYHAGAALDLWERDAGYEEAYFLAGVSWTAGRWEYRASAAALALESDSSLRMGGEVSAGRIFRRGRRLEPLLGAGATVYRTDTMPHQDPGLALAPLLIVGTRTSVSSGISLRLEYRGVYGIFPSLFTGVSFAPGAR